MSFNLLPAEIIECIVVNLDYPSFNSFILTHKRVASVCNTECVLKWYLKQVQLFLLHNNMTRTRPGFYHNVIKSQLEQIDTQSYINLKREWESCIPVLEVLICCNEYRTERIMYLFVSPVEYWSIEEIILDQQYVIDPWVQNIRRYFFWHSTSLYEDYHSHTHSIDAMSYNEITEDEQKTVKLKVFRFIYRYLKQSKYLIYNRKSGSLKLLANSIVNRYITHFNVTKYDESHISQHLQKVSLQCLETALNNYGFPTSYGYTSTEKFDSWYIDRILGR